jgi:hypothetical protein
LKRNYGVGLALAVVVSVVVVLVSVDGLMVAAGLSAGEVVVVVVVDSVETEAAGLSLAIGDALSAGDAAGAAVSVFCSHAARSAAPARMQISFFIGCG